MVTVAPELPMTSPGRQEGHGPLSDVECRHWAGRTPPPNNPPPNMAAANFVVITNGEGCVLNGTAVVTVLINQ